MAVGKSKRTSKGKKGSKKKTIDTFARKEWYDVRAPTKIFPSEHVGKTCVNKSHGIKLASDSLKGRVFEVSQADISNLDDKHHHRKIKLQVEAVRGRECLTDFVGMDVTRDFLCYYVKKWFTTITAFVDAKTKDGYTVRVFLYTFTRRKQFDRQFYDESTTYAKRSQVRAIRAIMQTEIKNMCAINDMAQVVKKLTQDYLAGDIEKKCVQVFPVHKLFVSKVKVIKKPAFDNARLLSLHATSGSANKNVGGGAAEANLLQVEAEN